MSKLSIQDWVKTTNLHYIILTHVEQFSNDITSYNELIQSMKNPSDFENLNEYIKYCKSVQKQLSEEKVDGHIKITKALNRVLDEFHFLIKTPSEQLLIEYIKYLKKQWGITHVKFKYQ